MNGTSDSRPYSAISYTNLSLPSPRPSPIRWERENLRQSERK
jgi:hypothetical protein